MQGSAGASIIMHPITRYENPRGFELNGLDLGIGNRHKTHHRSNILHPGKDVKITEHSSYNILHFKLPNKKHEDGKGPMRNKLWKFLLTLLEEDVNEDYIKWIDKEKGKFRMVKTSVVAALWGKANSRSGMTYEKMTRAMRYYYKMNVLKKVPHRNLYYQFGPKIIANFFKISKDKNNETVVTIDLNSKLKIKDVNDGRESAPSEASSTSDTEELTEISKEMNEKESFYSTKTAFITSSRMDYHDKPDVIFNVLPQASEQTLTKTRIFFPKNYSKK